MSEVIGVSHLKAYVFDDDVLISGANLSTTYFTKRQDRYYLFRNAARLAAFVRSLVKVLLLHPDRDSIQIFRVSIAAV